MRRSGLLLLISALALSAAVVLPTSREETEEVDYSEPSPLEQVEVEDSSEQMGSTDKVIRRRAAEGDSSSSEELKTGAKEEVKESADSSAESSSSEEEQKTENAAKIYGSQATDSAARRRRSDERYRNLYLLATICPKADTSHLEKGSSLDRRIEISDMYAICDSLKQ